MFLYSKIQKGTKLSDNIQRRRWFRYRNTKRMDSGVIVHRKTNQDIANEKLELIKSNQLFNRHKRRFEKHKDDYKTCLNCKAYPLYRVSYHYKVCANCFCCFLFSDRCLRIYTSTLLKYIRSTEHLLMKGDRIRVAPKIITDCCIWANLLYCIKVYH